MATRYFILIDGIEGDVTFDGYEGWFELGSYSFSEVGAYDTIGEARPAQFTPLDLFFLSGNEALADLLMTMSTGDMISSAQIVAVEEGGDKGAFRSLELTLNDVYVGSVQSGGNYGGLGTNVSLSYTEIGVATFEQTADEGVQDTGFFGWDILSNKEIGAEALQLPSLDDEFSFSPDPVSYYIKIDGVAGSTAGKSVPGEGWTELADFSFGGSNSINIGSLSGGGGAGKASFSDLSFFLTDDSMLADLLALNASGQMADAVQIIGVTAGKSVGRVFDLVLNDVLFTSVAETTEGGSAYSVAFNEIGLQTVSVGVDGTAGEVQSFGWSRQQNQAISFASLERPVATSEASLNQPVQYFIRIDGVDGDSQVDGREGWFELASLSLAQANPASIFSSSVGVANLSDISIVLANNTALTDLLVQAGASGDIASVEIEGVTGAADSKGQVVYELTLNDVDVSSVVTGDSAGSYSRVVQATLSYDKIGLVTTSGAGLREGYGWDLTRASAIDPDSLVEANSGSTTPGYQGTLKYYLRIDGVDGDSQAAGFTEWIDVAAYSFGASVGSALGFQDISVVLGSDGAIADLLSASASGRQIDAVSLVGVAGDKAAIVYELTLNDVHVSSVSESRTGEYGNPQVTFTFGQIGIEERGRLDTGAWGEVREFGWDVTQNIAIDPDTLDTPASGADGGGTGAVKYYARIDGIAGDSQAEGFEGWFELPVFSYAVSNTVSALSGAGGGAARPNLTDVYVILNQNAGLTELLASGASGDRLAAVEIVGVTADGKGAQEVYHLTLNDVVASSVSTGDYSGGGESAYAVSFDFDRIALETTTLSAAGVPAGKESFAWSVEETKAIDPSSLVSATAPGGATAADPDRYFIKIGNLEGDSTDADHKGWFDLATFSFGQSFDGARVNIGDLAAYLSSDASLTEMLEAAAKGEVITSVAIEGVTGGGKGSATVYELVLNDVQVQSVYDAASDGFQLVLDFGKIGITTWALRDSGSLGPSFEFGWDLVAAASIDPDTLVQPGDMAPQVAVTAQVLANDTGLSDSDLVTSDGRVTLTGTVSDDQGVAGVRVYDNGIEIGAATLAAGGWTFSAELGSGQHVLSAVATDTGGQTTATAAQPAITVDTAAPLLDVAAFALVQDTGASGTDFVSRDGRVTLTGSVSDGLAGVSLRVFDGEQDLGAATITGDAFTFETTLAEGTHRLTLVATDLAGNTTGFDTDTDIVIDQTAPDVAIAFQRLLIDTGDSAFDFVSSDGRIMLGGTASDDIDLVGVSIVNGDTVLGDAMLTGAGWSFETDLAVGSYALAASAVDLAGNVATSASQPTVTIVEDAPITARPKDKKVQGTDGADTIVLYTSTAKAQGEGGNDLFVLLDENFAGAKDNKGTIKIQGGDGYDTLDLTDFDEPFTMSLDGSRLYGAGLEIKLESIENIVGLGGNGETAFAGLASALHGDGDFLPGLSSWMWQQSHMLHPDFLV